MGADAHIIIRATSEQLTDNDLYLANELAFRRCGPGEAQLYRPDPARWFGAENTPKDIVVVRNPHRYYGPRYERGNWPRIKAILESVMKDVKGLTVFYGADYDGDDGTVPVSSEMIAQMDAHWAAVGNADYRPT